MGLSPRRARQVCGRLWTSVLTGPETTQPKRIPSPPDPVQQGHQAPGRGKTQGGMKWAVGPGLSMLRGAGAPRVHVCSPVRRLHGNPLTPRVSHGLPSVRCIPRRARGTLFAPQFGAWCSHLRPAPGGLNFQSPSVSLGIRAALSDSLLPWQD